MIASASPVQLCVTVSADCEADKEEAVKPLLDGTSLLRSTAGHWGMAAVV
jgi:hypothetical protein